jgi:phosphoribosyl 1,2-cyclic phosphodiesterase
VEFSTNGSDDVYILDAGSGLREYAEHYIASGKANTKRTFHFFMSHLHWDHIQGFPFFTPAFLPGNKLIVYGIHPELEAIFDYQMRPPWFPVTSNVLKSEIEFRQHQPGESFEINGLSIRTREQMHPGKSCGYRFDFEDRSMVYSTDSEHDERAYHDDYDFVDFISGADLLIFDAQYNLHDATFNKVNWGHSSNIMGVELASRGEVKHLVIFHHEPSNSDENLSEFLFSTRSYSDIYYSETDPERKKARFPEKISLAFDGMKLEV